VITRGLQHVGIPVRDMERSLAFYRDLFGVEPEFVADSRGPDVERLLGVPGADLAFAFIRLGDSILELLEYREPRGRDYDRRNCDVGAVHVCFEVEDVDEVHRELIEKGIPVSGPPLRMDSGPLAGYMALYFKDPDGVQLEAMSLPRAPASG
jgi:catechol 2,3-dioxygenase-like lactoylglutathione lyase family enzyme